MHKLCSLFLLALPVFAADSEPAKSDILYEYTPVDSLEQQPHETVDSWSRRLQLTLEKNDRALSIKKEQFEQLSQQRAELVAACKQLSTAVSAIKERAKTLEASAMHVDVAAADGQEAPFTVHLVKAGENLKGIAQKYFNDEAMAGQILVWNNGWIRDQDAELEEGLGLVLFYDESEAAGLQKAQSYFQNMK